MHKIGGNSDPAKGLSCGFPYSFPIEAGKTRGSQQKPLQSHVC